MSDRVAREPSPFRSGVVHTMLSLTVFSGLAAIGATGIHLTGDRSEASPARQIALFAPDEGVRPRLKTRFASTDVNPRLSPAGADTLDAAYGARADDPAAPNLGVDYNEGTARVVNASASVADADSVRINGVQVSAGNSWQETKDITSLSRAPVTAVTDRTSLGYLPKIADDGRTPAGVYARPFANPEGRPTVSIVVSGLGINYTHTKSAIEELPPEITLSFAPTARNIQSWVNQARAAGHEVLLEVPMAPYEYGRERPHSHVLDADLSEDQITSRLDYLMSRATGYFGVINYQGGKFATDANATSLVASALKSRGVAMVEDGTINRSAFVKAAEQGGLRFRQANTPIDARPDGEVIETKLLELEALALENGASLGTGFAYPITIDILKVWAERLDEKGIVLAPASAATRTARIDPVAEIEPKVEKAEAGQAGSKALNTAG